MNRGGLDITISQNVMDGANIAGSAQAIFCNGPQSYLGLWITNNWIINNKGRYGFFVNGNHKRQREPDTSRIDQRNLFDTTCKV